ncbi:MAG: hypothetical protein WCS84_15025 [Nocardioides sp.]
MTSGSTSIGTSDYERRFGFDLHGTAGVRRFALIDTGSDWLLHLVKDQG